jgi:hypothetical protein
MEDSPQNVREDNNMDLGKVGYYGEKLRNISNGRR